jgi:hypothetical protein
MDSVATNEAPAVEIVTPVEDAPIDRAFRFPRNKVLENPHVEFLVNEMLMAGGSPYTINEALMKIHGVQISVATIYAYKSDIYDKKMDMASPREKNEWVRRVEQTEKIKNLLYTNRIAFINSQIEMVEKLRKKIDETLGDDAVLHKVDPAMHRALTSDVALLVKTQRELYEEADKAMAVEERMEELKAKVAIAIGNLLLPKMGLGDTEIKVVSKQIQVTVETIRF